MSSQSKTDPSRPMNVEQIVKEAQCFDYNPLIPLKYWLRTASTILKEAEIYEREGNDQQTYLLLFRHAQLVLGNLAAHPEANQPEHRLAFAHAERDVQNDLAKLEILKPRIKKRFERYEQLVKDRVTGISLEPVRGSGLANDENHTQGPHKRWRPVSDVAVIDTSEALVADDSQELAVRLAEKEIRRRATARKATLQAGTSQEAEQGHGKAGLWGSLEDVPAPESYDIDGNTLSQRMQDINLQLGATKSKEGNSVSSRLSNQGLGTSYSYPKVPETKTLYAQKQDIRNSAPATPITRNDVRTPAQSPTPPPKDHIASPRGDEPRGTGRYDHSTPDDAPQLHATSPVRTDFKPANFVFRPSAYLENGSPLRTVFLPPELRHRFLSIAQENTRANLETCGILCGTLISNALFISKLVIPDQESTSDTCETVNESELFDYVDGEDLMVLGWIHTHPTQTCFMSSRDLHTHCGYQVMMPESIAVVCAPSKGEWGIFRLTDPPGMRVILNCAQSGLFHPHAESKIYTDALRPGHVHELKGLEFEVVDLRPGR